MTYGEAIDLKEGDQVIRHEGGSETWELGEVRTVRKIIIWKDDEEVFVYIQGDAHCNLKHTKLEIYKKGTNYSVF